jgi:hypothetical protein
MCELICAGEEVGPFGPAGLPGVRPFFRSSGAPTMMAQPQRDMIIALTVHHRIPAVHNAAFLPEPVASSATWWTYRVDSAADPHAADPRTMPVYDDGAARPDTSRPVDAAR